MKIIDLRSDTVTILTQAMREAIYKAEVGDDVFGEDPTINQLEQMAAKRVGKEAAMLVPSGTMGNLVCTLTHCSRGEEIILGDQSHIFLNEAGGTSALGGIHPRIVPNQPDGTISLESIKTAIRSDNIHYPKTRLICLENTHNYCHGLALTPEYTDLVADLAKENSLSLHLDGARVFNAAVALGIDVKKLTRSVDSLSFCLSKGLSAPIGSIVCGSGQFIQRARRNRKILGGGMRQAGIIAAAGITALKEMTERLAEDHKNARRLAEGLSQVDGLSIDLTKVQTNIVFFDMVGGPLSVEEFVRQSGEKGVKFLPLAKVGRFRMVTHHGIESEDIDTALEIIRSVMTGS